MAVCSPSGPGRLHHIALPTSSRWPKCTASPIVALWRRYSLSDHEPIDLLDQGNNKDGEADLFQPRMFQQVAAFLRDRVELLARDVLDPVEERGRVETMVAWLERCVGATDESVVTRTMSEPLDTRGGNYFKSMGKHGRYNSDFSLKSFVLL